MKGFVQNIEKLTLANEDFRQVLYTAPHSQLVLMALRPREEIGEEVHEENDQFFRFEAGQGKVVIAGIEHEVGDGMAVIIPAGTRHNVINSSNNESLKMYTIYSPAHHRDKVRHATKAQAEADAEEFDGVTTE
ncbi:cupin domain-containing protein [Candidatus Parcubacteria bacterium]|jgi:mannose-6-phosphate isomerase-like protein (cupin superfamily)|nr:MAG: cupin domain-containing protein [Candidatus Parcubacteria bacterium]